MANIWSARKGLDDFIYVANEIGEQYRVVLVGVSREQMLMLPQNVLGIERINNIEELVELYNKALVLLNPTYEDNFPTVNLEALACGTPVIAYNTGGCAEVLDAKTGICVLKGNKELLVSKIDEVSCLSRTDCRLKGLLYDKEIRYGEYVLLYNMIADYERGQE